MIWKLTTLPQNCGKGAAVQAGDHDSGLGDLVVPDPTGNRLLLRRAGQTERRTPNHRADGHADALLRGAGGSAFRPKPSAPARSSGE